MTTERRKPERAVKTLDDSHKEALSMTLDSKTQQEGKSSKSKTKRVLLSIIHYFVSGWRAYINLFSWALVVMLILLLLTGQVLTTNGLIFALGIALYILLYYLEKWLEKN